jgi:hypothetical protein
MAINHKKLIFIYVLKTVGISISKSLDVKNINSKK